MIWVYRSFRRLAVCITPCNLRKLLKAQIRFTTFVLVIFDV